MLLSHCDPITFGSHITALIVRRVRPHALTCDFVAYCDATISPVRIRTNIINTCSCVRACVRIMSESLRINDVAWTCDYFTRFFHSADVAFITLSRTNKKPRTHNCYQSRGQLTTPWFTNTRRLRLGGRTERGKQIKNQKPRDVQHKQPVPPPFNSCTKRICMCAAHCSQVMHISSINSGGAFRMRDQQTDNNTDNSHAHPKGIGGWVASNGTMGYTKKNALNYSRSEYWSHSTERVARGMRGQSTISATPFCAVRAAMQFFLWTPLKSMRQSSLR